MIEINNDTITEYKAYLRSLDAINGTTVNNRLRDLRAFLRYAASKKWCPLVHVKLIAHQEPEIIPLDDPQLREIYDACLITKSLDRVRDYTIMRLMEETGIRLGECMNLNMRDIDLRAGVIKLSKTKNKLAGAVYLTPTMKKELNLYLEARNRFLVSNGLNPKVEAVWIAVKCPSKGLAVAARTIQERIKRYGELAGVPVRVSPHSFRHTFARNFIVAGGDMLMLQKLLRHSSLDMVLRYVRLFGKDKQNSYLRVMESRKKSQAKSKKKDWPF